ncbi:L-ascorbate oxidase [Ananas comosus]|uniref:L-ascorbate oxidase n=1 Tax=Ananas comosus TaxID=4615 RepID=A0A199V4S2_ANACO|nr:L-ascorbate oxidase [Ananas comosus]
MSFSSKCFFAAETKSLLLLLCACASAIFVEARVHHHKWEISYQFKSPDCYRKLAVTINGQTPGPTIVAEQGDTVVVEVKNSLLTENVAVHWHGIRQIGTPWFDGTEGVTQCPIVPGDTFIYRFVVDRPGTYLYHAHYGMQRSAGLNGVIKVMVPKGVSEPFKYDHEHTILLNDWWHNSTYEQAVGLASVPGTCNASNPECSPPVFTVVPGKTYRLRIASISSLSALSFEIEGHNLTVVEADGHYVDPFVVQNLYIYSGETYSVLLKADRDPTRNYWAASHVVSRKPATPPATAIINYYPNPPLRSPRSAPPPGPAWNDTRTRIAQSRSVRAHPDHIQPVPPKPDRVIILLNTQNRVNGRMRWALNNVSYELPHTPYLVALKHGLRHVYNRAPPPDTYDYRGYDIRVPQKNPNATTSNAIYRVGFGSTVDVVLQNANTLTPNNSETHPWHLHGHDFWVLGYGSGKYNPGADPGSYNLRDPIMKNTVALHPMGWTALRFRADNPGVWAFHCHIESHFFMGMGIVFEEGVEKVGRLPEAILGCGESKILRNP